MRATAVLAFVLATALSGCTGGADDGTGGDGTSPANAGGSNHAPSASLIWAASESHPSDVVFTVDGEDADGDELAWSLAFGDASPGFGGSVLPATVNHTFAPGNFTVTLTVQDGRASGKDTVDLTISAPPPVQTVDGTYTANLEGCAAAAYDQAQTDPGASAGGTTNGITRVQFDVEPLSLGLPYSAAFTFDTGFLYVSVDFYAAGGALLSSDNTGQSPNFGSLTIAGTVPDGAAKAVLFACGGPASAKVHYEATPTPPQ